MECLWGITYTRSLRYSQYYMKSPYSLPFPSPLAIRHLHPMIQVAHEKCPILVDTVSATAEKFTTVFSLLGRCHSIYDQLFIDELKVTFQDQNNNYPHLTHRTCNISFPSSSLSLKMQEDHTVPWARRTGTYRLWSTRRTGGGVYPCPI